MNAFIEWCRKQEQQITGVVAKNAWNAALEHAAKVCKKVGPTEGPLALVTDGFVEAIRKEKSE